MRRTFAKPLLVQAAPQPPSGFALRGAALYVLCGAFTATSLGSAIFAYTVLFGDNLVASALRREARTIEHYERRIGTMQTEIDRLSSRGGVEHQRLRRRVSLLEGRHRKLAGAGRGGERADIPTAGLRGLGTDDLVTGSVDRRESDERIARALRAAEERQLADLAVLERRTKVQIKRLGKILRVHGIQPKARGGPLAELKGSDAFDKRFAAYEAALSQLEALRGLARGVPQGSPVRGRPVSSRFGPRRDPINGRRAVHAGLDFSAPRGHRVRSTAHGTVTFAGRRGGYGKMVEVEHAGGLRTRYAHLHRIGVSKGQRIEMGAVVGRVGSTGRSTGPHLHYEVRRGRQARDPETYLRLGRILAPLL